MSLCTTATLVGKVLGLGLVHDGHLHFALNVRIVSQSKPLLVEAKNSFPTLLSLRLLW